MDLLPRLLCCVSRFCRVRRPCSSALVAWCTSPCSTPALLWYVAAAEACLFSCCCLSPLLCLRLCLLADCFGCQALLLQDSFLYWWVGR